jgi:SagB-type dehydrogenase family enzyme
MTRCLRPLACALSAWALSAGAVAAQGVDSPLPLPPPDRKGTMPLEQALQQRRSIREFGAVPLTLGELSQLLWAAQGVTDPRGLRTTPSAGALAPLELYVVAGRVSGLAAGLYRYQPGAHALDAVKVGELRPQLAAVALGQTALLAAPAVLVIAAEPQRTRSRYGERAERYVQIEVGHAAQNVYLQCTASGLATVLIGAFDDRALRDTLGLPAALVPLGLMPVGRPR